MGVSLENRELEGAVLGALLLDNGAADRLGDLSPEDFFGHAEALAFEAALDLLRQGRAVDLQSLPAELGRRGQLAQVGGPAWVASLTEKCASVASVATYSAQVRELAQARRLRSRLNLAAQALDKGATLAEAAGAALEGATEALAGERLEACPTVAEALQAIEDRSQGHGRPFLDLGLGPDLNRHAPEPGDLITIAARTSVGKSATQIALCERLAERGQRVLFLSLEMPAGQVQNRRLAAEAGVPLAVISGREGRVPSRAEWERLAEAGARLAPRPFKILSGPRGLPGILATIRAEHARAPLTLAAIDHLGKIDLPKADRHDLAIGRATTALADLARALGIVVGLGVQFNRLSDREGSEGLPREPRLSDLRDSGMIEQDSSVVWLLHRTDHLRADPPEIHALEVFCAKSRNGPTGLARLAYEVATQRITPAASAGAASPRPFERRWANRAAPAWHGSEGEES